jgi:hypothetical protein
MVSRIVLVLVLFAFWSAGSGWYYVCKVKQVCKTEAVDENSLPISFEFNGIEPILGQGFDELKEKLLTNLEDKNKLKIIGLYNPSEVNNTLHADLGLARAYEAQQQLNFSNERVVLSSKSVDLDWSQDFVNALDFETVVISSNLIEREGGAVLILDENAVPEELPFAIEQFLNQIMENSTNGIIDIVGHSQDLGNPSDNFTSGYNVASLVRDRLVSKGYNEELINVVSQGSTERHSLNLNEEADTQNVVELYIR